MTPPAVLSMPLAAQAVRDLGSVDLSSTRVAVMRVVNNPTSNITVALLLLVAVTLLVLLLISLVLAFAMPSKKRVVKVRRYTGTPEEIAAIRAGAAERAAARAPSRTAPARRVSGKPLLGTPLLLVCGAVLVVSAYAVTSTDAYCTKTCHSSSVAAVSAQKAQHASCTSCHEGHVVTGIVGNSISRARMIAMQSVSTSASAAEAPVDSSACLHCHRSIRRGTTVSASGIKMSHAEVIAAGQPCTECHPRAGHSMQAYNQAMSACITCHDTRTASADCVTCHSTDPLLARASGESTETIGSGAIAYPAVRAANRDCGGCHDQKKHCDPCHGGVRMPHTPSFKDGGHARNAAFEAKTRCWRCHDPQVCGQECHSSFAADGRSSHGEVAKWRLEHRSASWDAGCECHRTRTRRDYPICYRCHDRETRALLPAKP